MLLCMGTLLLGLGLGLGLGLDLGQRQKDKQITGKDSMGFYTYYKCDVFF